MDTSLHCALHVTQDRARLLLTAAEGDLLKARLSTTPCHPRALLTLLEGLRLWSGQPLCVALSVDDRCLRWPGAPLFGDELWPTESQLVRFDVVSRDRRRVHLTGLGDFRQLRCSGARRSR
jgi:hypothetical protein